VEKIASHILSQQPTTNDLLQSLTRLLLCFSGLVVGVFVAFGDQLDSASYLQTPTTYVSSHRFALGQMAVEQGLSVCCSGIVP
jgi:hypothetical protein